MPVPTLAACVIAALWASALQAQGRERKNSASTVPIPEVLHFCAQHCLTFTPEKDGTLVNYTNLPGQYNVQRVLTVEKFTPELVVIHCKDTGSHPGEGTMKGRVQDGNSSATDGNWTISWGDSLDMLPGRDEDQERRARQSAERQEFFNYVLTDAKPDTVAGWRNNCATGIGQQMIDDTHAKGAQLPGLSDVCLAMPTRTARDGSLPDLYAKGTTRPRARYI